MSSIGSLNCTCPSCGIKFHTCQSDINRGRRFCSWKCFKIQAGKPAWARFKHYVGRRTPSGCILWKGAKNARGYGIIGTTGRKTMLAHRLSWQMHNGKIHDKLHVLHSCDVPDCINPDHLFLGTHQDNMRDMMKKNRQVQGERQGSAKLTRDDIRKIRQEHSEDGTSYSKLAEKYGVVISHICHIVKKKNWKHVS